MGKREYFAGKIKAVETIKSISLVNIEYEGTHPTEQGTSEIISQLQAAINEQIVMEGAEEDVTTARKYSHVQPVYKIGCRGCDTKDFTPHLCPSCLKIAETFDTQKLTEIIEKIKSEMFPDLEIIEDEDVEMKDSLKRTFTQDNGGKKHPRNSES